MSDNITVTINGQEIETQAGRLLIDVADRLETPLTRLSDRSVEELENLLDPGLPAVITCHGIRRWLTSSFITPWNTCEP